MARALDLDELVEHWTLLDDERDLIAGKRGPTRLGFALLLKPTPGSPTTRPARVCPATRACSATGPPWSTRTSARAAAGWSAACTRSAPSRRCESGTSMTWWRRG